MKMTHGRIEHLPLDSQALRGNRLGDPHQRYLVVYLPPTYEEEPTRRYPTLYLLASHGNTARSFLNWRAWEENMPERLNRLMGSGEVPPALVVMPDCWTRLGGSQYLNSSMGNYEDYLITEIVPLVDSTYRTTGRRGIVGHSSGGYGAIVQAMRHPDVFHAVGCHSGDMYWEFTCLPAIAELHQLLGKYGGAEEFIRNISQVYPKSSAFWKSVMALCWSAAHGSNPDAPLGFDLPFDPETGALDQAVWERWQPFDPLRMLDQPAYQDALRGMKQVYVTVGSYDEYQLQVGARLFSRKLTALGIAHLFEELPTTHSGSEVPYDRSFALLVESLKS